MAEIFDWLPSVIDGVLGFFGLGNSAENRRSQENINQINLDYAKAMTEKQWERDDTTYQRSVADATAAGFSPLAVLDGGLSPNGSPLTYQGQAPQFDINAALQAFSQAGNKLFQSNESDKKQAHELKIQEKEFKNNISLLQEELKNAKTEKSIDLQNSIDILEATTNANVFSKEYDSYIEELREYGVVEIVEYTDYEEYKQAKALWLSDFNTFYTSDELKEKTTTKGAKGEVHTNINAKATTGVPGILSGEVSGNVGGSVEGSSQTQEENAKRIENATFKFMVANPYPVYKKTYKVSK